MVLVALLRAANVGGTGLLPMRTLRAVASEAGFRNPRTVGQSGNLVFETDRAERDAALALSRALLTALGRPIELVVRDLATLCALVAANPFRNADPSTVLIVFTASPPPAAFVPADGPGGERLAVGPGSALIVHYPDGVGRSRLVLPDWARAGTARNLRTVARLAI